MELAQELPKLPPRLIRFFEKYPPQLYSAKYTGVTLPLTRRDAKLARIAKAEQKNQSQILQQQEAQSTTPVPSSPQVKISPSSSEPSIPTASIADASQTTSSSPRPPSSHTRFPPNPFLPSLNPTTNRWAGARIGLRQQADLIKLAKRHSIESLLPPSRKSTAFKEARILERGLRVKGTGEGESVKGHKWERTMPALLQKRKEALEGMPALVRDWERRGHGRGWKQWPKAKTK